MVRLGLIGAGSMANSVHYPSLAGFPDVELAALCDIDPARLAATAERFRIPRVFSDYRQLLAQTPVDAVYVLMPPHQLFDIVLNALDLGKHVFIEKPPGVTSGQTRSLARAAQRSGVIGMVGFNRRYIPLIRQCKAKVDARGGVTQCVATFYKDYLGQPPYYGGAVDILTSDCIHAVDMLRFLGGEPVDVVSIVESREAEFDTVYNALLRFRNGASGVLLGNWTVGGRVHRFEIHGRGISAFVDPDDCAAVIVENGAPEKIGTRESAGSEEFRVYYGFEAENRHFIDCVKSGKQPESSFDDAVLTMELVDRLRRDLL